MAPTNGDHVEQPPPTQDQINLALDNRIGEVNGLLTNRIAQLEATIQQMELRGKPK